MKPVTANHAARAAPASAKLLVVVLGLAWGFNWIAARSILDVLQPWTLRAVGVGLGALTLFVAAAMRGVPLRIVRQDWHKLAIAGFFNVAAFAVCSIYAQVYGTTARAIVITYSMPIWTAVLARLLLKERLNTVKLVALGLCATGLAVLIWPLARSGLPFGALSALVCAWSWAAGTIYMKWAKIAAPNLVSAAWQLLFGWLMLTAGMLAFEGLPQLWPLPGHIVAWIAYNAVIGMGLAYFLWFVIIDRLSTATASLGTLLVPVVGVIGSALVIGERPGLYDSIGFALIFAAAAIILLQRDVKHTEMPE